MGSPAGTVNIDADFSTILSNYPGNDRLPPPLKKTIDDLNRPYLPEKGPNTSCCLQICWAFNKSGIKVPSGNFRPKEPKRIASKIAGEYYLMAVDEMINWLTRDFQEPYELGNPTGPGKEQIAAFTAAIQGMEGVMTFANGHIELWNRYNIVQDTGSSVMLPGWVWKQKPVRFWRIGNTIATQFTGLDFARFEGWWDVNDGKQYYYYIDLAKKKVAYTKTKPKNSAVRTLDSFVNRGDVTLVGQKLIFDWDPADGGATRETFNYDPNDPTTMRGLSNRYMNLVATKMFV